MKKYQYGVAKSGTDKRRESFFHFPEQTVARAVRKIKMSEKHYLISVGLL